MTFKESLKILNIEDYEERIFKSNSRGELFHVIDYITMAEDVKSTPIEDLFREWFEWTVKQAESKLKRPETIYQYIRKLFLEFLETFQK